ncbi:MAG TPA: small multi-drug export protein [Spirochaetia bacterium]|nr:small multi-drug export protein [Spirochaetia bacterium]
MHIIRFLTIAGLSALEFKAAIPAGLAMRLDPFSTALAATLGATLDTLVILFLGETIRRRFVEKHGRATGSTRYGWLQKVYTRFGPAGLGLLAPLLVGTPIGTALGISLGLKPRPLFFWMVTGTALWSAVLTAVAVGGISGWRLFFHR